MRPRKILTKWACSPAAVPIVLLILLLLAFGPLIPFLGFFWDDWPVILTGRLQGAAGFLDFYEYDRPVSAWTYILTFPLLGSQPIAWHIFSLLLRWGTATGMWWTLVQLWPRQRREVTWAAVLFAIYPVFTQQSISVAYSQHWLTYLLFFISMAAMLQAHRVARFRRLLTVIALATSLLQMLTMEYFVGLELLRPFMLWIIAKEVAPAFQKRLIFVLRGWLPYLIAFGVFIVWRFFLLEFPGEEANPPILLYTILSNPVDGILRFLQIILQDTVYLLVTVWANILTPANLIIQDASIMFSWSIGAAAAAGLVFFLSQTRPGEDPSGETPGSWSRQAALLGLTALLFGMLPVWFTDRQIIVGTYSNRFGLPAMFGSSLLITALLIELIRRPMHRIALVSLLAGLAVTMHLQVANDYRWSWIHQSRFYWQLNWRAPALEPGTAIFSDGEIFKYVGLYSTSAGINLIYPPQQSGNQLPYYFFSLGREFAYDMPLFERGVPIIKTFRHYSFEGNSREGIVIYYNPGDHDCMNVLDIQDDATPDLPNITRQALENANNDLILPGPQQPGFPPTEIFGPEPEHGWCYLYQKAELEAQLGNWDAVYAIAEQARAAGFHPEKSTSNTPLEWMAFIEAYARKEQWNRAEQLSLEILEIDTRIDARLCSLWGILKTSTSESDARNQAAENVTESARCP